MNHDVTLTISQSELEVLISHHVYLVDAHGLDTPERTSVRLERIAELNALRAPTPTKKVANE